MIDRASMYPDRQPDNIDALLEEYAPLVKRIGLHLKGRLPPSIELDDLMQVGMMGLVNAVAHYDPGQGASFATYAGIRIKGAMLDEVRRLGWSPRSLQSRAKQVSDAIHAVEMRYGRQARAFDIARELGLELEEYQQIAAELASSRLLSLEEEQEEKNYEPADAFDPGEQVQQYSVKEALRLAIDTLPDKEKLMMSLYYNEGLNLREIGMVLEVSESRVSQIHGQALARTRARMKDWLSE